MYITTRRFRTPLDIATLGVGVAVILGSFGYAKWRGASLALTTAFANFLLFVLVVLAWAFLDNPTVVLQWSLVHEAGVLSPWEPLTLLTSMYTHANLPHILYNMLALVLIGMPLEERVGARVFGIGYVASGLLGGLGFLLLNYDSTFVLLGASGAVSGPFGMFARLYPRVRLAILPVPMYVVFILNMVAQFFLAVYVGGPVAYPAHIVGAGAGFGLAPLLVRQRQSAARPEALPVEYLAPLATTPELQGILQTLQGESIPEIRDAWLTRFRQKARCPRCGGPLAWTRGTARSACGWDLRRP